MNSNNESSILGAINHALFTATIVMAILKYIAGKDIPTIVVFTPLIAVAIMFAIQLVIIVLAMGFIHLVESRERNKRWRNFNRPIESAPKLYWNPETKEMGGVESMPEYDKWKDEE